MSADKLAQLLQESLMLLDPSYDDARIFAAEAEAALAAHQAQQACPVPCSSGCQTPRACEYNGCAARAAQQAQPAHVQGWQEVPMCSDNAVLHALDMARTESRKQGDQALFLAFGRAMWRQFNAMAAPQQGSKT